MSIPTDEDFARPRRRADIDENWDEMSVSAQQKLREVADLHHFALFPRDICRFAAVLFFPTDEALAAAKTGGFDGIARGLIRNAVNEFRSGACSEYEISVELDSYENVKRNFGGSYFYRLR